MSKFIVIFLFFFDAGVQTQVMYLYKMYKQQHAIQAQLVLNATHNQHILYWQNTAAPTKEVS